MERTISLHAVSKNYKRSSAKAVEMILRGGKTQTAEDRLVVQAYETSIARGSSVNSRQAPTTLLFWRRFWSEGFSRA